MTKNMKNYFESDCSCCIYSKAVFLWRFRDPKPIRVPRIENRVPTDPYRVLTFSLKKPALRYMFHSPLLSVKLINFN